MTAEMLRIPAGVAVGGAAGQLAEERGLPEARSCLGVAVRPSAGGPFYPQKVLRTSWGPLSGPRAPGMDASAEGGRIATAEMRGFAAAISSVRAKPGFIAPGEGR